LDTTIPLAHQVKYRLNPNYATMVKQDINKLLVVGFIEFVEEATLLSPIVIVPKKNGELKICINFSKLYATIKKYPYPLLFIDEMLNTLAGYEAYSFLDGYSRYHHISTTPKDKYKIAFVTN